MDFLKVKLDKIFDGVFVGPLHMIGDILRKRNLVRRISNKKAVQGVWGGVMSV